MLNSEPIFFDDLAYYPQLILKRTRYSDEEMMFLTGKSKNKARTRNPEKCIPLNKNPFNTIFLFTHGQCSIQIGLNNYALKPNDLVVIPEHVVCHSSCLIENCGYCIHFKTEYLLPFLKISRIEDILPFTSDAKYVLMLTLDQGKSIESLFEEIYREYDLSSKEKDNIIRCYIEILLLKCKEYFQGSLSVIHPNVNRSFALTRQFKILVEKKFINMRRVDEYASIMHISPKHLEKTVKETLGITPKKLINDIVLAEAKILLKQTEKTISEIAQDLKFEDQSYFSRFFKRHTLITPQEYRDLV
jgi:AraC family transcriptional activator of pobA